MFRKVLLYKRKKDGVGNFFFLRSIVTEPVNFGGTGTGIGKKASVPVLGRQLS